MAEFPDDLNYGVTLGDPSANPGTNYSPPKLQTSNPTNNKPITQAAAAPQSNYDISKAGHPVACIATFAFKALALVFYEIIGQITPNIITFILVIVLSSLDFWVVKNVTGRLLVGLRWWSQIDSTGKEKWRFENPKQLRTVNKIDKTIFWASQAIGTLIWGVFLIVNIISLSIFWSLLLFVCFSLCGTNLYAYYQCRGDHQKKLGDLKKAGVKKLFENVMG